MNEGEGELKTSHLGASSLGLLTVLPRPLHSFWRDGFGGTVAFWRDGKVGLRDAVATALFLAHRGEHKGKVVARRADRITL